MRTSFHLPFHGAALWLLLSSSSLLLDNSNAFLSSVKNHRHCLTSSSKCKDGFSSSLCGEKKRIVVIGNGMVGQRFMENILKDEDVAEDVQLVTFCEEPRAAYNRVRLTSYFENRECEYLSSFVFHVQYFTHFGFDLIRNMSFYSHSNFVFFFCHRRSIHVEHDWRL